MGVDAADVVPLVAGQLVPADPALDAHAPAGQDRVDGAPVPGGNGVPLLENEVFILEIFFVRML